MGEGRLGSTLAAMARSVGTIRRLMLRGRVLRPGPSAQHLWQTARRMGQPWWRFVHSYVYARWQAAYVKLALVGLEQGIGRRLFLPLALKIASPRQWADGHHGKVMPTESAKGLVQVQEEVQMTVPEWVIPFESARDLVLSHSGQIVAMDCPCRLARDHPCEPVDVCLVMAEPLASFVLDHCPDRSRAITREEAVAILEAEARRGHVHHAFFKDAMLGRFYALCNCCSCCCGAMSAQRNGIPMLISSGYVSRVEEARCKVCGECAHACPFGAIQVASFPTVNAQVCMGCGVCVATCSAGALSLVRDVTKPAPLELPV